MVTSIRQAEGFLWLPSAFFLPNIHKKGEENVIFLSFLVPETGVEPVRTFRSTGF